MTTNRLNKRLATYIPTDIIIEQKKSVAQIIQDGAEQLGYGSPTSEDDLAFANFLGDYIWARLRINAECKSPVSDVLLGFLSENLDLIKIYTETHRSLWNVKKEKSSENEE